MKKKMKREEGLWEIMREALRVFFLGTSEECYVLSLFVFSGFSIWNTIFTRVVFMLI